MNYEKDIKDELLNTIRDYEDKQVSSFESAKKEVERILEAESVLCHNYEEYWKTSDEFEKSLDKYLDFKAIQTPNSSLYMMEKLFKEMNVRMCNNETRAKGCDILSR